jgi:hypothetical protein
MGYLVDESRVVLDLGTALDVVFEAITRILTHTRGNKPSMDYIEVAIEMLEPEIYIIDLTPRIEASRQEIGVWSVGKYLQLSGIVLKTRGLERGDCQEIGTRTEIA